MCVATGMGLLFWMLQHLAACKGFFTIKPARRADGVHSQAEVDAYIFKCISENAMGCLDVATGIGQMWRHESEKTPDPKGALMKMSFMAERQVNMGYLMPYMLAVLDTRLYCAVRGGVNNTFGSSSVKGKTSNQPAAHVAHDAFLLKRAKFHFM